MSKPKVSVDIAWGPDPIAEEGLGQLGIEYTTGVIQLKQIDWKQSKENRARDIFLDVLHKDNIKQSMADRCFMPMIVVSKVAVGYVIVGGNHRATAAMELLGQDGEIHVYVVACTPVQFEILAAVLNLRNGKPLSYDERVAKAIEWHRVLDYPLTTACELVGVKIGAVKDRIKASDVACKMKVDLTSGMQSAIAKIPLSHIKLQPVVEAYGNLFRSRKGRVSISEMKNVVAEVEKATTQDEMVQKLVAITTKPRRLVADADKPRVELLRAIKVLSTASENASKAKTTLVGLSENERKEVDELWQKIAKNMQSFL